jgi:hypothetical protein
MIEVYRFGRPEHDPKSFGWMEVGVEKICDAQDKFSKVCDEG